MPQIIGPPVVLGIFFHFGQESVVQPSFLLPKNILAGAWMKGFRAKLKKGMHIIIPNESPPIRANDFKLLTCDFILATEHGVFG